MSALGPLPSSDYALISARASHLAPASGPWAWCPIGTTPFRRYQYNTLPTKCQHLFEKNFKKIKGACPERKEEASAKDRRRKGMRGLTTSLG